LNKDWCVCIPEPLIPNMGLGMKLACKPLAWAISLATNLYVITLSAMLRASEYLKSISCWLEATS